MNYENIRNIHEVRREKVKKYKELLQYYLIDRYGDTGKILLDDLPCEDIDRCIKKIEKNIELYRKYI